jgi:hypothetical protein
MVITHDNPDTLQADQVDQADQADYAAPSRSHKGRNFIVGGALLVAGALAVVAVVESGNSTKSDPAPTPISTPKVSSASRDDAVRVLVDSGVVPAASLDDGSQIGAPGASRDDAVRVLVDSGVVPAASLDDGSQIGSPTTLRDSTANGHVPPARHSPENSRQQPTHGAGWRR